MQKTKKTKKTNNSRKRQQALKMQKLQQAQKKQRAQQRQEAFEMVKAQVLSCGKTMAPVFLRVLLFTGLYFLVELFGCLILKPQEYTGLLFGIAWAFLLGSVTAVLPKLAGRILFGVTYFFAFVWTLAQTGYYSVFDKMMWLSTIAYAGEGAEFLGDVLGGFPLVWWLGGLLLLGLGVVAVWKFPKNDEKLWFRLPVLLIPVAMVMVICYLPEQIFLKDQDIWGTKSEFGQSSSYRAAYTTMFDAKRTYDICGIYQLTARDIWKHEIYPITPAYQKELEEQTQEIDEYFSQRPEKTENDMTGIFEGKNVVLVLMESMDDWMITDKETPTILRLMQEGINFTDFYTPGYGSARTLNSEFCMNTGIYLPTNGNYVFNYVNNDFNQSIASQMNANGYSSEVFHYNEESFYSRGVFEPVMGYNQYNGYGDYETDKNRLYDEDLVFDIPQLRELFFREGQTFNTVITRSAHLSYKYNEVLSHYALKQYPEYKGMYGSEEEDCARVKAKLVDDFFARLLAELEAEGQLENTVVIGMTDHYTYGYKNMEELYAHSGVTDTMLLEKTPCFIWSADCPSVTVDKTLNTADLVPTVLNLMGFETTKAYLGQDAFDPNYDGFVYFPDGSWISGGVACKVNGNNRTVLYNESGKTLTDAYFEEMTQRVQAFIHISNLLLTSDYYS